VIAEADEDTTGKIEITTRDRKEETAEAIADEAKKGFDLLVVGMEKVVDAEGRFDKKIADIAAGFRGPMAIVAAKGPHLDQPAPAGFNILAPVSGSAVSRRGAEVAVALARLNTEPLKVVYVSTTRDKGARRRRVSFSLAPEEAILKDTAAAAARYDVEVKTALHTNAAPEQAILQEINSSGADLIVVGVDRISGDNLNFGSVAQAVLSKSKVSVMLIADGEAPQKG
jgi:nucleotide-binding universal stress UspA family protein